MNKITRDELIEKVEKIICVNISYNLRANLIDLISNGKCTFILVTRQYIVL